MELTKNEYAIAQALYSNVDIDSVLLSFRYVKNDIMNYIVAVATQMWNDFIYISMP